MIQFMDGIVDFISTLEKDKALLSDYKENSRKTSLLYTPENAKQYVL